MGKIIGIDLGTTNSVVAVMESSDPKVRRLFELAFAKRPAEELYDLRKNPAQIDSVAGKPEYAEIQKKLAGVLMTELKATRDPRVLGKGDTFDQYPYYGGGVPDKSTATPGRAER